MADLNSLTIKGDLKTIDESWAKYSEQLECLKSGYTPLHEAARRGHTHILDFLLRKGANVNALSINQETALFYAAEGKHTDCEILLLTHKADVHTGNLSPLSTADGEFLNYLTSQDTATTSNTDFISRSLRSAIKMESMYILEKVALKIPLNYDLARIATEAAQMNKHKSTAFLLLTLAVVKNDNELVERLYGTNKTGNALSRDTRKMAHLIPTHVPLTLAKKLNHVSMFDSILTKTGLKRSGSAIEISWDHIGINQLSPQIFSQLSMTSHWSLSHNNLSSLNCFGFYLEKLRVLDVSHNHIATIDAELFKMPCLSSLNLSHNLISSLPMFQGMSKLARLDLSYNSFYQVPYCLANCPFLNYLNLSFNEINKLPSWLALLERLEDFRLEGVSLCDFGDRQSFKKIKQLLKVKLNNSISNHEIKTIVTGPSEVGKKYFMKFFNRHCQEVECSQSKPIHSVFVKTTNCSDSDELGNYSYNIWNIQSSLDSLDIIPIEKVLYTSFAMYVVVFDTNLLKTELIKLWAWLDSISMLASPSCVIFLGYNLVATPLSKIEQETLKLTLSTELLPLVKHFSNSLIFHETFLQIFGEQDDSSLTTSIKPILQAMHQSAMLLECSDGRPYMGRLVQKTAVVFKKEIDLFNKSKNLSPFMLLSDFESALSCLKNESINELKSIASLVSGYLNDVGCILNIPNDSTNHFIVWNFDSLFQLLLNFFEEMKDNHKNQFLVESSICFPPIFSHKYVEEKLYECISSVQPPSSHKKFPTIINSLISIFIKQKLLIPVVMKPSPFYLLPFNLNMTQTDVTASQVLNFKTSDVKWKYTTKHVLSNRQFVEIMEAILNEVVIDNDIHAWLWKDGILLRNCNDDIFIAFNSFSVTLSASIFSPCFKLIKDIITKALNRYDTAIVTIFCSKCLQERRDSTTAEISLDHCIDLLYQSDDKNAVVYCGEEHKNDVSQMLPHIALTKNLGCKHQSSLTKDKMTSFSDPQYGVTTFEKSLKIESDLQSTHDQVLLFKQYRSPCISSHFGILVDHCVVQSPDTIFPQAKNTHIPPIHGTMADVVKTSFVSPILLYRIAVQLAYAFKVAPALSNALESVQIWSMDLKDAFICSLAIKNVYDPHLFSPSKRINSWKKLMKNIIDSAKSNGPKSLGMKFAVRYHVLEEICNNCKQSRDLDEVISTLSKVEIQLLSCIYSIFNEKQFFLSSPQFVTQALKLDETSPHSSFIPQTSSGQNLTEIWVPISSGPDSEIMMAIFKLGSTTLETISALNITSESILAVSVCQKCVWISSLLTSDISCISILDIQSKIILHNIKLKSNACTCIAEYCMSSNNHVYLGTEKGYILIFPSNIELIKAKNFQPLYKRISSAAEISSIAVSQSLLWVLTTDNCLYALECNNIETGDLQLKQKFDLKSNDSDVFRHILLDEDTQTLYYYGRKAVKMSNGPMQSISGLTFDSQSCFSLSEINQLVLHSFDTDFHISSATEANGCLWIGLSTGHIFILNKNKLLYQMQPYSQPVTSLSSLKYETISGLFEVCVMSCGRNIHSLFPTSVSHIKFQDEAGGVILLWNAPTPETLSQMILLENSAGHYLDSYESLANMIHMGQFGDCIPFEHLDHCNKDDQGISNPNCDLSLITQSTADRDKELSFWGYIEVCLPAKEIFRLSFSCKPTYQCLLDKIVANQGTHTTQDIFQLGYNLGQNKMLISLSNDAELDCYLNTNDRSPLVLLY